MRNRDAAEAGSFAREATFSFFNDLGATADWSIEHLVGLFRKLLQATGLAEDLDVEAMLATYRNR